MDSKDEKFHKQLNEEKKRPVACGREVDTDCEKCNDRKTVYEESRFGVRCQAICSASYTIQYDFDMHNQCRRAANFGSNLDGYRYCKEHSNVYRRFITDVMIDRKVDRDLQDEMFRQLFAVYRRQSDPDSFEYDKMSTRHKFGDDIFTDSRWLRLLLPILSKVATDKRELLTFFAIETFPTGSVKLFFLDQERRVIIAEWDEWTTYLPLLIMLYARQVTYEWLYKAIGTVSDDYLGIKSFNSASQMLWEPIFRNRLLAQVLLLDPARLFAKYEYDEKHYHHPSNKYEFTEPGQNEYQSKGKEVEWLRYPLTNRPVTLMPSMCDRKKKLECKGSILFPVVRYKSLYYSKEAEETDNVSPFCGKFYFYEPSSNVLLNLGKVLIAGSKPHAFWLLLNEAMKTGTKNDVILKVVTKTAEDIVAYNAKHEPKYDTYNTTNVYHGVQSILRSFDQKGMFFLKMLPYWGEPPATDHDYEQYYFSILKNETSIPFIASMQSTPLWPYDKEANKSLLKFEMGAHDGFDQPLCQLAAFLGYDTVLLQHEPGEERSVTEILDVRPNSYHFLYRSTIERTAPPHHSRRYATIWFTDYGFVQV